MSGAGGGVGGRQAEELLRKDSSEVAHSHLSLQVGYRTVSHMQTAKAGPHGISRAVRGNHPLRTRAVSWLPRFFPSRFIWFLILSALPATRTLFSGVCCAFSLRRSTVAGPSAAFAVQRGGEDSRARVVVLGFFWSVSRRPANIDEKSAFSLSLSSLSFSLSLSLFLSLLPSPAPSWPARPTLYPHGDYPAPAVKR